MSTDYFNKKVRRKKTRCPNCNYTLDNYVNFCPMCGQENHGKRASLSLLFKDFIQDYFTFDNKFFRSIVPLMFKPGFLTNEYLQGKRKRYFLPIRFYLFVSFICLLIFSFISEEGIVINTNKNEQKLIKTDTTHFSDSSINYTEIRYIYSPNTNDTVYKVIEEPSPYDTITYKSSYYSSGDYSKKEAVRFALEMDRRMDKIESKEGELLFSQKINKYFPVFLFMMIPVLAFIMKLFYRKKRRKNLYIDHFVFSLHLQSFNFILFFLFSIAEIWFKHYADFILFIILLFVYITIASKKVYDFHYAGAFFRSLGLYSVTLIVSLILFAGLLFSVAFSI